MFLEVVCTRKLLEAIRPLQAGVDEEDRIRIESGKVISARGQ